MGMLLKLAMIFMVFGCSAGEKAPEPPAEEKKPIPMSKVVVDAPPPPMAPSVPPAPLVNPQVPTPLPVEGYVTASHVGPDVPTAEPMPVTVVLHGNYDRPEWQCDTWKPVAGFYGWVLCPRGIPTPWAEPEADRWMYRGPQIVDKEIDACLEALKKAYPGRVSDEGAVLVGFSLGGNYAPWLFSAKPGRFEYLFLVEGGEKKMDAPSVRALKRAGIRGVGLAYGVGTRRQAALEILKRLKKFSIKSVYVDMKGSGHNYRSDFHTTGQAALRELVEAQ